MDDTHMIGLYATFIFLIFLTVMPYFVIKFVQKSRKRDKEKEE